MTALLPNCYDCGRFTRVESGCAWKMVYSGWPPTPDREVYKCSRCTGANGGFPPQAGIRPEYSTGIIAPYPGRGILIKNPGRGIAIKIW